MRRAPGKFLGDDEAIQAVLFLERRFPNSVLLGVMGPAQADHRATQWFETRALICPEPHMRTWA